MKKIYSENPYINLPKSAYWKTGVKESSILDIDSLYKKKFELTSNTKLITMGSCFAQHVGRELKRNGYAVLDYEVAPAGLPASKHGDYGFSMFSARYGNIYTVAHLLQLVNEAIGLIEIKDCAWCKDNYFVDAMRPTIEKFGYITKEEVELHRKFHLSRVRQLLLDADVLVFTLGLTESWRNKKNYNIYPLAPGVNGGVWNPQFYEFKNFGFNDILNDFYRLIETLDKFRCDRPNLRFILTVSPVPLTATGSHNHILEASTYSKSVLRAVAGELQNSSDRIAYFPSYELITNPASKGSFFGDNLRTVTSAGVSVVMKHFFAEHGSMLNNEISQIVGPMVDSSCEDALLERYV